MDSDHEDSENDPILTEYRVRKEAQNHHGAKQAEVFLYCMLAAVALLGYSFSTVSSPTSSLVFLSPLILLIPSTFIIISLRNIMDREVAYIRVFIEAERRHLRFESACRRFVWPRVWPGKLRYYDYISVYQAMVYCNIGFGLLSIALAIYFGLLHGGRLDYATLALTALGFVLVLSCICYMLISETKFSHERIEEVWRQVKQSMEEHAGEQHI